METGIKGYSTLTVTEDLTASSVGSGTMKVFSTPSMLSLIERTCWKSILPYLEPGQGSVGTKVELEHLAPAPMGCEVRCETILVEVDRRRLVFEAKVHLGETLLGRCTHERFIVNEDRFLSKVSAVK